MGVAEQAPSREQLSKYAQQQWEVRARAHPGKGARYRSSWACLQNCPYAHWRRPCWGASIGLAAPHAC